MKKFRVVLCDTEEDFVIPFMNYINRNTQVPMLAMAFTEIRAAMEYIQKHPPDLIVSGWEEPAFKECVGKLSVLWLTDIGQAQESDRNLQYEMGRFFSASVYVNRMMQILYAEHQGFCAGIQGVCLAVYSPIGRSGTTRLAHKLCQVLSVLPAGGGCIYLGWECFASEDDEKLPMEELLYYIKQRDNFISLKVKELAQQRNGYDVIESAGDYRQLRELTREDICWFLQKVREEGIYTHLVADIGSSCLTELDALTEFDGIYIPVLEEEPSEKKLQTFIRQMIRQGFWEELYYKCYPVEDCLFKNDLELEELAGQIEGWRLQGNLKAFDENGSWKHGARADMQRIGDSDTEYIRWDDGDSGCRNSEGIG